MPNSQPVDIWNFQVYMECAEASKSTSTNGFSFMPAKYGKTINSRGILCQVVVCEQFFLAVPSICYVTFEGLMCGLYTDKPRGMVSISSEFPKRNSFAITAGYWTKAKARVDL